MWRVMYRTSKFRHTIYLCVAADGIIQNIPALHAEWLGRQFSEFCKAVKRKYPKSFKRQQWNDEMTKQEAIEACRAALTYGRGEDEADEIVAALREPSERDGRRDRLVMCGEAAIEELYLDENNNSPADVRMAIRNLRNGPSERELPLPDSEDWWWEWNQGWRRIREIEFQDGEWCYWDEGGWTVCNPGRWVQAIPPPSTPNRRSYGRSSYYRTT